MQHEHGYLHDRVRRFVADGVLFAGRLRRIVLLLEHFGDDAQPLVCSVSEC